MRIDIEIIIAIILILFFTNIILTFRLIINKLKRDDKREHRALLKRKWISGWVDKGHINKVRPYFDILSQSRRLIKLDEVLEGNVAKRLKDERIIKRNVSMLNSKFKLRRIEAAVNVSILATPEIARKLEEALRKEKKRQVKLYFANALSDIEDEKSIPVLIESLVGENKWYREKVNMLINEFGSKVYKYIPDYLNDNRIEIVDCLIDIASENPSGNLKEYIFDKIDNYTKEREELINVVKSYEEGINNKGILHYEIKSANKQKDYEKWLKNWGCSQNVKENKCEGLIKLYDEIMTKAMNVAQKYYFIDFTKEKYIQNENIQIRKKAVITLSMIKDESTIYRLIDLLYDENVAKAAQISITQLIQNYPEYIDEVADMLMSKRETGVRQMLADALSGKTEYFIMKLLTNERSQAESIIKQILLLGKTSDFIGFANNNKAIELENKLVKILKDVLAKKPEYTDEFSVYLNEKMLLKAELQKRTIYQPKKQYIAKPNLKKYLIYILIIAVLMFPLAHIAKYSSGIGVWSFGKHLKTYIVDFNYYLAYYSLAINTIYLILIVLSRQNVKRQAKIWQLKNDRLLFKKKMLPGISIIAPAYNEEKVIVESTNSLLNLKYPDYNVIIVNDGSGDNTLGVLIDYFELERVDYTFERKLKVAPIRGIYRNPSYPKLFVVDTENAGKADSLNAGIMISDKEYFCCIDSDSLLESDALLKLASQTLDEEVETPALGGNVFPINGCKVYKGYITSKNIPKNTVAKLQTIEYIRAFMSGRLGWAYINNLLIISGTFGIFRKERVIGIGGYLTKSSRYGSDTVGEDMELVVRIAHLMHKQRLKFKTNYCYNANCWTEVPEKLNQLKKQRLRWYRGLVETLYFHKATIFNPRYGSMGLVGMPYFFLFEMVGPLIEIQGYIMVFLAFIFGLLSSQIALLLFLTSVMLGIFVSVVSLMISETQNSYYNYRDLLKLIDIAIVENFGPRQLFSFWRVLGFLNMFSKEHSWGSQERKGFDKNKPTIKKSREK